MIELRTYDRIQREARLVTWLCCRRSVFATHPDSGCVYCR